MEKTNLEHIDYLRTYANPVLQKMCLELLETKPTDPTEIRNFMINWLQKAVKPEKEEITEDKEEVQP
jgi:hypothetical protein